MNSSAAIAVTLVLLLVVVGISVYQRQAAERTLDVLNAWMGHHMSDLILSWGPPDSIEPAGRPGHQVLVYKHVRTVILPGRATTRINPYLRQAETWYNAPQTLVRECWWMMWADETGRLYWWKWSGGRCPVPSGP